MIASARLSALADGLAVGLFAQMVPLILSQTPQKRCDLWKRVVLRRPLKVLGKSHHLEARFWRMTLPDCPSHCGRVRE
jgi:hypothetical protein